MAGRTEQARAQIIIDGQQAETLLQQLGTRSKELKDELRRLKAEGKDFSGVQKELRQTESAMNSFKRATFDVSKVMQNLSKATMKDLSRASNQLKADLKGMERGTQEYINKSRQLSVVRTELNKVQAEINGTAAAQQRANGSFGGGLKSMMAWAGGIYGLTSFMGSSVSEYMEAEAAQKKVEQAVRQTGMAAGFTAKELNAMAQEYQNSTIYDADEIMNKVTAQLLSFPNVTGETFKLAQTAALDLATLLGGDLQSASLQLGKALQDPVRGLTALRKSGVSFTEEQKEQIKVLQESGRLEEAQAIILSEVNRQYGGQAEAAAQGAGSIDQLKNAWGDLKEDVGGFLVGEGKGVITWLKGAIGWLRNNGDAILKFAKTIGSLVAGWLAYSATVRGITLIQKGWNAIMVTSTTVLNLFKKGVKDSQGNVMTFSQKLSKINIAGFIGILTTVIGLVMTFKDELFGVSAETKMWNDVNEDAAQIAAEEKKQLHLVVAELQSTKEGTEARKIAIEKMNKEFGKYLPNLLTEKSSYKEIAAAIKSVNDQIEKKATLQAYENMLSKLIETREATKMLMEDIQESGRGVTMDEAMQIGNYQKVEERIGKITSKITALQNATDQTQVKTENLTDTNEDAAESFNTVSKKAEEVKTAYEQLTAKISEYQKQQQDAIAKGDVDAANAIAEKIAALNQEKTLYDELIKRMNDAAAAELLMKQYGIGAPGKMQSRSTQNPKGIGAPDQITDFRDVSGEMAENQKLIDDYNNWRIEQEQATQQKLVELAKQSGDIIFEYSRRRMEEKYTAEEEKLKKQYEDKKISEEVFNAQMASLEQRKKAEQNRMNMKQALWERSVQAVQIGIQAFKDVAAIKGQAAILAANPATLPYVPMALAQIPITIGMAAAQAALIAATPIPQAARGRYPVIGEEDGKTYNAEYRGTPRRTHITRSPGLYLAGESPEMVISNPHLRNLQMNYPEVLRAINATRVTQFAAGNYPAPVAAQSNDALLAVVNKLLQKLDQPWKGYVVKKDIDDIQANEDFISDNFTG